jgi:hypothetical protein
MIVKMSIIKVESPESKVQGCEENSGLKTMDSVNATG